MSVNIIVPNLDEVVKSRFDGLRSIVDRAELGEQIAAIPLDIFGRFGNYLDISRETYHTIGGDPGTGKSAFAHLAYVMWPYVWMKNHQLAQAQGVGDGTDIKLKIFVHNMERPWNFIMAKWCCLRIFHKYKIIVDAKQVLGRSKLRLSDDVFDKIRESLDYFEEAADIIEVMPGALNPTGINKNMEKWSKHNGSTIVKRNKENRIIKETYIPKDPNLITIVLVDHIGKCKNERISSDSTTYLTDKQTIDRTSTYLAEARDKWGFTPVVVQQFNRSISETSRRTSGNMDLTPELRDFKGSANTVEDSDIILALFNPWRYQVSTWKGYRVSQMVAPSGHNRFRGISVLKNSYGIDDVHLGMQFIGEVGSFGIMDKPDKLGDAEYRKYRLLGNLAND